MSINCVHMLLDLLFKHITNVSVLLKEKFDVLKMFRLLVSSRYHRVSKMQLHLVLFALFIPPNTNFSTKYLMMCKVYTNVGGIK